MARQGLDQWLRERRKSEGLSFREAGAKLGLSYGTIQGIERGARPSPATIQKMARGFARGGKERLALEDRLLTLAGYRTPRPRAAEIRPAVGRVLDIMADLDDREVALMAQFGEFLAGMEATSVTRSAEDGKP